MGSLEPWQSRELYDLVKELQPDCMVSGRLGNDVYDFAVMADNKLPESALHAPWQSAASMFPETWSYRSWQERGEVQDKYGEKLRDLIEVVSHGGNYLLNIGPASDGSVVPFEADVIRSIGRWLDENGDAIYGTRPSPFKNAVFDWGHVTVKDNVMYLLLTGEYPEVGISYPIAEGLCDVEGASWQIYGGMCCIDVTPEMFGKPDVKVIKLVYDRPVADGFTYPYLLGTDIMTWKNAMPDYSYSCFDYYSNYRSTVGYGWEVSVQHPLKKVELTYTAEEVGRVVKVCVGDMEMEVTLDSLDAVSLKPSVEVGVLEFGRMRGGVFDNSVSVDRVPQWVALDGTSVQVPSQGFDNYLIRTELHVDKSSSVVFDVCTGNGVELLVDGNTMMKHLNPYRTTDRSEKVLMDIPAGRHEVVLRSYNRFEDSVVAGFALSDDQRVYRMTLILPHVLGRGAVHVGVSPLDISSPHTDCGLHNLRLRLVK